MLASVGTTLSRVTEFEGCADQSLWTFKRQALDGKKPKSWLQGHDAWTGPLTNTRLGLMDWLLAQQNPHGPDTWARWAREEQQVASMSTSPHS